MRPGRSRPGRAARGRGGGPWPGRPADGLVPQDPLLGACGLRGPAEPTGCAGALDSLARAALDPAVGLRECPDTPPLCFTAGPRPFPPGTYLFICLPLETFPIPSLSVPSLGESFRCCCGTGIRCELAGLGSGVESRTEAPFFAGGYQESWSRGVSLLGLCNLSALQAPHARSNCHTSAASEAWLLGLLK